MWACADADIWDPENDAFLPLAYDHTDVVEGKQAARQALRERLGLTGWGDKPIIGVVTRLTAQKGGAALQHRSVCAAGRPLACTCLCTVKGKLGNVTDMPGQCCMIRVPRLLLFCVSPWHWHFSCIWLHRCWLAHLSPCCRPEQCLSPDPCKLLLCRPLTAVHLIFSLRAVDCPFSSSLHHFDAGIQLIKHSLWRTLDRGGQFVLLGSAPDPRIQVTSCFTAIDTCWALQWVLCSSDPEHMLW